MILYIIIAAVIAFVLMVISALVVWFLHWKNQIEQQFNEMQVEMRMGNWKTRQEIGQVQYLINCFGMNPFAISESIVSVEKEEGVNVTRVVLKDRTLVFFDHQISGIASSLMDVLLQRSLMINN